MNRTAFAAGLLSLVVPVGGAGGVKDYADAPPPAHTGGFGEPTCAECHFDGEPNDPGGTLEITGLPDRYGAGETYTLVVALNRPELRSAGFQLAIRLAEGEGRGSQAGTARVTDDRARATSSDGVDYLHQTLRGSQAEDAARWTIEWTAPQGGAGPVAIHVAANAGNGDDSAFGDYIYTDSMVVPPRAAGALRPAHQRRSSPGR